MPRCACRQHQILYIERQHRRREVVSRLLDRLHLYRWQGWWDAGTDIKVMARWRRLRADRSAPYFGRESS